MKSEVSEASSTDSEPCTPSQQTNWDDITPQEAEALPSNPFRSDPPPRGSSTFSGRFWLTDELGREAQTSCSVHITKDRLFVHRELSIPTNFLNAARVRSFGTLRRKHIVEIYYSNPINNELERLSLCALANPLLGTHDREGARSLLEAINRVRGLPPQPTNSTIDNREPLHCEVCGAQPAYYISYTYLLGFVLGFYLDGTIRRVHCPEHNRAFGLPRYLATAVVGWIGVSIFAWPRTLVASALALRPTFGRLTTLLVLIPLLIVAPIVLSLLYVIAEPWVSILDWR